MKAARCAGLIAIGTGLFLVGSGFAQGEPPVRRAIPANEPPPATPGPRIPTQAAPAPDQGGAESAPTDNVSSPQRQLEYADGLFAQKQYDLAVPEFEKYLMQYPNAAGRANAFFFLGESYRALNKTAAARRNFQAVLDDYPESDFAAPAAYVLAESAFTEKNYGSALPLFHRAAAKSKEAPVVLSSRYFEARCLESLDRKDDALALYLQVIDAKNPNPYREDSRSAAGAILLARGRKADALRQYEALSNEAQKNSAKAEAAVRGGIIALDLIQPEKGKIDKGMVEKATTLLQKGRSSAEGKFKGIAEVAIFRLYYISGQYQQLLAEFEKQPPRFPEESRPELMLLAANAQRQLGHAKEADALYADIIAKFPKREEAKDAQYQRLINIYNSSPAEVVEAVNQFLETSPAAERADQARLLKAEALYKEGKYGEAAPIYAEVREGQLSPKLRADAAYKLAWCYVQARDIPHIVEACTFFIQTFPESPQAPAAFAQRAMAYQQDKNYDVALSDLNAILTRYPNAKEREAAMQQKALILGQQGNNKGMSDTFRQLLKEFPKSSVAAQAQFYIGKAAFDAKDYKTCIAPLNAARQLNKEQYYDAASVRIVSAYFYLKDRKNLTNEVDTFLAANPAAAIPANILEWLGVENYNEKNYPAAEKYLSALGRTGSTAGVRPDFWFYLGDTESRLKNFEEAEKAFTQYSADGDGSGRQGESVAGLRRG